MDHRGSDPVQESRSILWEECSLMQAMQAANTAPGS
jgi:hypothetical protein